MNRKKVLLLKIYPLFITDWAAQPPRTLGNAHTMAKRRKPYGHISGTTMIPTVTGFMRTFVLLFNRPVWASQEQLMNLGKNTFPYRLTSGMHVLLVFFFCVIVSFALTNNTYTRIFPGYPPADHEVGNFLTTKRTEDESYRRACCFIDALFQHTNYTLEMELDSQWGIEKVAREFRILMTAGQTMKEHNEFRRRFYQQVVRIAEEKLMAEDVCLL